MNALKMLHDDYKEENNNLSVQIKNCNDRIESSEQKEYYETLKYKYMKRKLEVMKLINLIEIDLYN